MAKVSTYRTVPGLFMALRKLPKEANAKLRDASQQIADNVAAEASLRAFGLGGVAGLVAPTIKSGRDRVPVVKMGGSTRLPTVGRSGTGYYQRSRSGPRQTIGDVIWGAEFGGGARPTTQQFRPHLGQTGYFLWPTVRARSDEILSDYSEALQKALEAI